MSDDIQKVGIVGAGQMGNGIAHVFALAGYDVILNDISQDSLTAALALIERNLERQVSRDKITQAEMSAAMARISTTMKPLKMRSLRICCPILSPIRSLPPTPRRSPSLGLHRAPIAPKNSWGFTS
jgi:UDP-N-acetyl-D-mannosaminuronate dehydrogenase